MKKEIKLPKEFTELHSSIEYLRKLIGKKIHFTNKYLRGFTGTITGLKEVQYDNSIHTRYTRTKSSISRLGYEFNDGFVLRIDYILAVMLIEGGYAQNATGIETYEIID